MASAMKSSATSQSTGDAIRGKLMELFVLVNSQLDALTLANPTSALAGQSSALRRLLRVRGGDN